MPLVPFNRPLVVPAFECYLNQRKTLLCCKAFVNFRCIFFFQIEFLLGYQIDMKSGLTHGMRNRGIYRLLPMASNAILLQIRIRYHLSNNHLSNNQTVHQNQSSCSPASAPSRSKKIKTRMRNPMETLLPALMPTIPPTATLIS